MGTRKNTDPITASEIQEFVSTRDDFGLELYVYRLALENGFKASHAGTYEDAVTHKPRQYDVRAFIERSQLRIDLAIECKSLQPACPLVVSRVERASDESFHEVVHSFKRDLSVHSLPAVSQNLFTPAKSVRFHRMHSLFGAREFVGKSTSQLQRRNGELESNDSSVYDKWSQAMSSAEELIFDSIYRYKKLDGNDGLTVVLPVLVVSDQTLWVVDYSHEGEIVNMPTQVKEATLYLGREYWRKDRIRHTISHLHIVTQTGLAALLRSIRDDDSVWESLFPCNRVEDFRPYRVEPTIGIRVPINK